MRALKHLLGGRHVDVEMRQRMSRLQLYNLVWATLVTALTPQLGISDVALKKTCVKFDVPVPPRGYWAKLEVGKPMFKVALPPRAAGMNDEVVVGERNRYWYNYPTNGEILGWLPELPAFPEDVAVVRDRVRRIIGKVCVSVGREDRQEYRRSGSAAFCRSGPVRQ
jgi:hypothetical protein